MVEKTKEGYGIESIEHLNTRDAMRARIQMYLGSDDTDGIYQAFKEIINNSTDEALAGYGDTIYINVNEPENTIQIADCGRGIPFGIKDGRNILVAIYTESHTGGKFNNDVYKNASGLNGIGGTAVCMSSDYFQVSSVRGDIVAVATFDKGQLREYAERTREDWEFTNKVPIKTSGTVVTFRPDKEVFKNMVETFTYEKICKEIKNIAYLNKGVRFIITDAVTRNKVEYYSKNGIADFIAEKVTKPLMKKPIIVSQSDGVDELEIAFMWSNDLSQSYVFVNGLYCPEGGTPVTGAKTSLTTQMKKLSKKDFDGDLIRKGLVYAINCKVQNPSFANQTKSKINNPNLRTLASQAFKEGLELFSKTPEFESIVEMLVKVQRAEQAANKAREAALQSNNDIQKALKKKFVCAEKLTDCRYHDERSEIMICEGKSAKGALVKARNSDFTACFDLRGKIINALKNPEEKVAANEEVKQLHIALGCGIGNKFNINKLRYGKITLMADMDKDGYDIICLLLSFFYYYYPQLISAGKIYWGVTPLFRVDTRDKTYYAYSDEELAKLPKGEVQRFKGLGEADPDDFEATIFSKDSRRVKITMNDAESAFTYFDTLLGTNIQARKDYIFSHANFETLED